MPVAAVDPGAFSTNVASPGANAGSTTLPVASSNGFNVGDTVTIGAGQTLETTTVQATGGGQLTLAAPLKYGHGVGEAISRSGSGLAYYDQELPQDACAAGRVARFGKASEPSLTSGGRLFATGLSSRGRLTSALHNTAFYGQPLVAWTAGPRRLGLRGAVEQDQVPVPPAQGSLRDEGDHHRSRRASSYRCRPGRGGTGCAASTTRCRAAHSR